jgi:hypothetical protein
MVTTCYILDIKLLTCGNAHLTYEANCIIFKHVLITLNVQTDSLSYTWN